MNPLLIALAPVGFFTVTSSLAQHAERAVYDEDGQLYPMPDKTTVVLPTLDEEKYLPRTMDSLLNQNVVRAYPDRFEIMVVDSDSQDSTVDIAKSMGAKVVKAGKGKLTARNLGVQKAQGDVIYSVDSDTVYPPNMFNLTLRHFQDPEVVGVFSPRMHLDEMFNKWEGILVIATPPRMWGSNSAFRKSAFQAVGGFDDTIDQQDVNDMIKEEEAGFYSKLSQVGKIHYERFAPAYTDMRRFTHSDKTFDAQVKQKVRFSPERVF